MSKISDYISKKNSLITNPIYNEFLQGEHPNTDDLNTILFDKILEQQTVAANKLSIIVGIMVFSLICSVAAIIISLVAI